MAALETVEGHTVTIDLSRFEKPDQDLVRMHMLLEYGMHETVVTNVGLSIKVHTPASMSSADAQSIADALIPLERHLNV